MRRTIRDDGGRRRPPANKADPLRPERDRHAAEVEREHEPDLASSDAQNHAPRVGELSGGASAGDGEPRSDRGIDALDVAGGAKVDGGSDEVRPGDADGRPGANAADRQRIRDAPERQHAAAAGHAEDETGADDME